MDDREIQLWARINAHEFLIEQLWAGVLLENPDPVAAAKANGDRLRLLAKRVTIPAEFEKELADSLSAQLEAALADIWRKIQRRVEDVA